MAVTTCDQVKTFFQTTRIQGAEWHIVPHKQQRLKITCMSILAEKQFALDEAFLNNLHAHHCFLTFRQPSLTHFFPTDFPFSH